MKVKICEECLYDIPPGEEPDEYEIVPVEDCEWREKSSKRRDANEGF